MHFLGGFIGMRFKQGRRGGLVSLITIISTLSIAIGMIVLIVGLSAMNGFEKELRQRILSVVPHAEFTSPVGDLANWRQLSSVLMENQHIVSVAPYISFTGLLENGTKLSAALIKGIDAKKEQSMNALSRFVEGNGWQQFGQYHNTIIIGSGLAAYLGVKQGSKLTLLIPEISYRHQLKAPKRVSVQVAGILALSGNLGYKFALISLTDAQKYTHASDSVTGISATVDDVFNAHNLATAAAKRVQKNLHINSWEYEYGYMYRDIQMIRSIMYLAMVLVIGISCFSIVSTLIIAVKDKQADIAVLKTLGATNKLIKQVFLCYGLLVGIIGSGVGIIVGVVLSLNLSAVMAFVESIRGHKFLDGKIYFIDFMPSELHISDVVVVFITTMLFSLLASCYPARRACNIDPAQILNNH